MGQNQNKSIRLLLVDDELDLRKILQLRFEMDCFEVFEASNGNKALAIMNQQQIDVVITDLKMPFGDGIELIKEIRKKNFSCPGIIVMTGFKILSLEDAFNLGVEAYFKKPFETDHLIHKATFLCKPLEEWWSEKSVDSISGVINIPASSLTEAERERKIKIGRGGIFSPYAKGDFHVGDSVELKLIVNSKPTLFGIGLIRWMRIHNEEGRSNGLGIEFISIEHNFINDHIQWIHHLRRACYIPIDLD